jgi:hypothetical protein
VVVFKVVVFDELADFIEFADFGRGGGFTALVLMGNKSSREGNSSSLESSK